MSYQVLARKWRPGTFDEMVGQVHVLKALVNALDQERLHHAYLFTGTRGVGKTTIARLLAKSLNCEQGVSSKPCGQCASCREIAEGRFVDLIEVDAASRTKVEDTRELLENVQYAPTRGRFKVYLIDEVHMLSTSSFNALLKTLEEPPPHVKFLLATTDPQKLPVTVLSRCLQFNLKNMSREHIVQHLNHILTVEQVPFDEPSLWAIAEGAQGSMRDALSLTDQAIAFGHGALAEQEVAAMLGTVDLKRVLNLVRALLQKDADGLLAMVSELDEHTPDYQTLLTELMSTLHRVAIAQAVPSAISNHKGDRDAIMALAKAGYAEDIQLYYQIAGKSKGELSLAPSERAGFEMTLLRMLAFSQTPPSSIDTLPPLTTQAPETTQPSAAPVKPAVSTPEPVSIPASEEVAPDVGPSETTSEAAVPSEPVNAAETPVKKTPAESVDAAEVLTQPASQPEPATVPEPVSEPEPEPEITVQEDPHPAGAVDTTSMLEPVAEQPPIETPTEENLLSEPDSASDPESKVVETEPQTAAELSDVATWPDTDLDADPVFWWQVTLHRLGLSGMTKTLFAHSQWRGYENGQLSLVISPNYRKIMNDSHQQYLLQAITDWLPDCQSLTYEFGAVDKTPQLWLDQLVQAANDRAYQHLKADAFVETLINEFKGELIQESAVPNNSPIPSGA
ncbi:DNA polymerase III subunit gamma/tau [Reinekea blandensis]|uniref:DNA polymerase III subunit gamma/tau n=1 Tax=Reinekea blandensis MED297 TaxID=314283 RepID=A4BJR3_9GAMM|nr:DNA polymerase III subunit gamma/tau [Reinekea blandensis]EAR07638.1 DNA polymerase III subunits gamma and tau [Reinekea sp. MED297] [Reinekea blandensis MED297]